MISEDLAIYFSKYLLSQALLITTPIISVACLAGFVISVLQTITQIQDSTLSAIIKLLAIVGMLFYFSPWMLRQLCLFSKQIIEQIPDYLP